MIKSYSKREFERILNNNGYHLARVKGSHHVYERSDDGDIITINIKPRPVIIRRLIKQHRLKVR